MKDPILLNKLWREVDKGNVTASTSGDLSIFKYTQDCHIEDRWNEVNRQARGIIFRTDGTVVARPFEKFFNLNERSETEPKNLPWSEGVEVYEKVDGSCGAGYISTLTVDEYEALGMTPESTGVIPGHTPMWRLATPGSMESEQAIEGTKILYEILEVPGDPIEPPEGYVVQGYVVHIPNRRVFRYNLEHLPQDCTPVFEIIYPENRIVVDYHGVRELVLLAIFEKNGVEWHPRRVDQIAELCGFRRPKRYDINLRESIPFEENSEGYVARFGNGFRVKIKSPAYLRIHRLLNHLSPKGVVELIRGNEYRFVLSQLPKEIAKDFDDVRAYVQGIFNRIQSNAFANLAGMQSAIPANGSRKEKAEWIIANVPNAEVGFVFSLLDGKDIEDRIWKYVLEIVKDEVPSI